MSDHKAGESMSAASLVVLFRPSSPEVQLPRYGSDGAAGADVHAWLSDPVHVQPGSRVLIPTGLHPQIPRGYEIQVRSRSGLAAKHGIFVVNSPGTIDSDYRGEIKIILGNISDEAVTIMPGERIAQFVVAPVIQAEFTFTSELDDTDRGQGGFGSTGR